MKTLLLFFLFAPLLLWAKPEIIKPKVKTPTSFAIVVDKQSYARVKSAIEASRDAIDRDGLATYILVDEWENPDAIREILKKLYADKKMPLEGVALVGDVPVPMIRDAQFLTSAFKMDQKRPWQQSSIPSDRYYDDFDLQFDFLKQDSLQPLYFYYSLNPHSAMTIESDIYSGRIKPMAREGKDKYTVLANYLRKVVRLKAQQNPLNDLTMARGHGYNSESRDAWAGEQLALKEQFPSLFKSGNYIRFYDYDFNWPARIPYMTAVQRETADIVLFHHHGADDTQYLNGYPEGSGVNLSIDNIKRYLRSKVLTAYERKKDVEKTKQDYIKSLGVPSEWLDDALEPEVIRKDSLFNAGMDIHLSDIHAIRPNARFVMFDACYNGSFHLDDCIANAYIFGDGNTVVTQGNTVNTIQDKWPDEYLGLLACGVRIGQWGRHVHFLETHIIGDPTYHFANTVDPALDMNRAIVVSKKDNAMWYKLLNYPNADVQCMALRKLYENHAPGLPELLQKTYEASLFGVVRMECMKLLYQMNSPELVDVLKLAVCDSYELVRRFAVQYIGNLGTDELIPALVYALLNENMSARVNYQARDAIMLMDMDKLTAEIKRQAGASGHWVNKEEVVQQLLSLVQRNQNSWQSAAGVISDLTSSAKDKSFDIVRQRNHPAVGAAELLIAFVLDSSRDMQLRITTVETLSWYTHSVKRPEIIAACEQLIRANENLQLVNEAIKTKNRLK